MENVQSYGCSRIRFFSAAVLPRCKPAYSLAAPRSLPKGVTWHTICCRVFRMKKLLYILFALVLLCACEPTDYGSGAGAWMYDRTRICEGTGYHVAYSIRDNTVYEGLGYHVSYTIRGNQVYEGTGYHVRYTIRDDRICEGTGYHVSYTIRN